MRYFGSIKLGTGGMARAHALSFKNLLKEVELLSYEKEESYIFSSSYRQIDKILYQLKEFGITKFERDFGVHKVIWKLFGTQEQLSNFKDN